MAKTAKHALALKLGDDPVSSLAAAMLRQAVADARRGDDDAATWLRGGGSVWAMWVWGTDPHTWRAYLRRGGFMREISVGDAEHIGRWTQRKIEDAMMRSRSVRIVLDVSASGDVRGSVTETESVLPAIAKRVINQPAKP